MDIQNILRELQELKKRDREILALQKTVRQLEMKNNIQQKEEFALMRAKLSREDMQVRTLYELETTDKPSFKNDFIEIGQPDRERKILLGDLMGNTIGSVQMFAFTPSDLGLDGFLRCDGAEYLKSDYPKLFSLIGDIWGTGNYPKPSEGYFRVPDLKNWFIRANAGAVGRQQQDALQQHHHTSTYPTLKYQDGNTGSTRTVREKEADEQRDTSNVIGARTDTETRPKNISLDFWIRAY